MKVYIASDHGGYWLKESLKIDLRSMGFDVTDMGNKEFNQVDDYPDFVIPLAKKVAEDVGSMGIVLGRSGNGEAIAVNKVKGIRAALCFDEKMAKMAREHDDANVLSLGADFTDKLLAEKIAAVFLDTPFPGKEKYQRRIEKIRKYEST